MNVMNVMDVYVNIQPYGESQDGSCHPKGQMQTRATWDKYKQKRERGEETDKTVRLIESSTIERQSRQRKCVKLAHTN
jgi:hypothetical protein